MKKNISYRLQFIDTTIHRNKCKYGHDNKNMKRVELSTNIVTAILNIQNIKDYLIENKCFCCNENYQKSLFTHINTWTVVKNSKKHHYLRNKIFTD